MKNAIAILAGGGPAPGINTVIASVTKIFLAHGFRVIGLHNGYKGIFSKEQEMIDLDFRIADEIYARGGSYLHMSRYRPSATATIRLPTYTYRRLLTMTFLFPKECLHLVTNLPRTKVP